MRGSRCSSSRTWEKSARGGLASLLAAALLKGILSHPAGEPMANAVETHRLIGQCPAGAVSPDGCDSVDGCAGAAGGCAGGVVEGVVGWAFCCRSMTVDAKFRCFAKMARLNDVTIKMAATATVNLLKKLAGPRLPNTV